MTSLAEAFGLGRGCFGREGVLRCTGTFPETGGWAGSCLGEMALYASLCGTAKLYTIFSARTH